MIDDDWCCSVVVAGGHGPPLRLVAASRTGARGFCPDISLKVAAPSHTVRATWIVLFMRFPAVT